VDVEVVIIRTMSGRCPTQVAHSVGVGRLKSHISFVVYILPP
jgi:hypothetical protein